MTNETHQTDPNTIYGEFELPPDPERVMEGFRDTGYSFNTAVADLADNSIAAKATVIRIGLTLEDSGEIGFAILDNGSGMNRDALWNAMQYGSSVSGQQSPLSKFGLGLKTASTSQARKLVVTTRASKSDPLLTSSWDLDLVAQRNKWIVQFVEPDARSIEFHEMASLDGHGTVVEWRKIDRILVSYKDNKGQHRIKALKKLEEKLIEHLGTVFERFVDSNYQDAPNVKIYVNGNEVQPWDPFAKEFNSFVKETFLEADGISSKVNVRTYVLPREEQVPPGTNYKQKIKPANDNQGVYVYRENRLIAGPDWLDLVKKEPHANLARLELNFDQSWDEIFSVDVMKSEIKIQDGFRDELIAVMNFARNLAQERRRKGLPPAEPKDMHQGAANVISGRANDLSGATVTEAKPGAATAGVLNTFGPQKLKVRVIEQSNDKNTKISVAVNGLDDGKLWEPTVTANEASGRSEVSVAISGTHPFYRKVYLPHQGNQETIQALDFLLWAFANAELNYTNDQNRKTLEELRFEISRNLRTLVESLPEPEIDEGEMTQISDPTVE
jgi:hypothetical protein